MSVTAAELAPALSGKDGAVIVALRVQPGAKRSRIMGMHGDRLRVAIDAPPVDGKANKALTRWLAKELGLRRSEVTLISGQGGRDKRIRCDTERATLEQALIDAIS